MEIILPLIVLAVVISHYVDSRTENDAAEWSQPEARYDGVLLAF